MLKRPLPTALRRAGGRVLVIAILLATGYATWAAQPAQAVPMLPGQAGSDFTARIEFSQDRGEPARFVAMKTFGEHFAMVDGDANGRPSVTARIVPVLHKGALAFDVALRIEQAGKLLASPRLVVRDGRQAAVQQGSEADGRFRGVELAVTVSARDPAAAAKRARSFEVPAPSTAPADERGASAIASPPHVYPVDVLKRGVTGKVVLIVDVAADGSVAAAKIDRSAGNARLDEAALQAVSTWRFKPAMQDGKPVPSQVRVPVDFELHDDHGEPVKEARAALARQATGHAVQASGWSGYGRMLGSLNASWATPVAPVDEC